MNKSIYSDQKFYHHESDRHLMKVKNFSHFHFKGSFYWVFCQETTIIEEKSKPNSPMECHIFPIWIKILMFNKKKPGKNARLF
jgi:hypothetical protein